MGDMPKGSGEMLGCGRWRGLMTPWDTVLPLLRPHQARFLLHLIAACMTHAEPRGPGQPSLSPQRNTHPVHLQGELGDDHAGPECLTCTWPAWSRAQPWSQSPRCHYLTPAVAGLSSEVFIHMTNMCQGLLICQDYKGKLAQSFWLRKRFMMPSVFLPSFLLSGSD